MLSLEGDLARFEGAAAVEDAEPLLGFLLGGANRAVDLSRCSALHLAVVQVLRVARPRLIAPAADGPLTRWVVPYLEPPPVGPGEAP
jgi:hypothetical protein